MGDRRGQNIGDFQPNSGDDGERRTLREDLTIGLINSDLVRPCGKKKDIPMLAGILLTNSMRSISEERINHQRPSPAEFRFTATLGNCRTHRENHGFIGIRYD